MRRGGIWWLGGLALALAGGLEVVSAAPATGAARSQERFSGSAQVIAVEVPVQVVRDGEPVRGLAAGDFEVWEEHRKLQVTGFEVLDLAAWPSGAAGPASTGMPAAARRHFLFLFDLAFSGPKSIARARQAAADLVLDLHPSDLVAVATYSASRGPQLVLGFTSDRRQIDSAVRNLGLPDMIARPVDPLRLVLEEVLGAQNSMPLVPDPLADVVDVATMTRLEGVTREVERADRSAQRNHIRVFSRSLSDLARQIAVVEGRKYLVFLSEGFDSALVQGTPDPKRREEIRESALNGQSWLINSDELFGETQSGNEVERMLEEFRRADCVIQAVDIGGVRAGADQGVPHLGGRDSLLMMAQRSGGDLYENFNDLSEAMGRMLKRTGVTYLLAVQPDPLAPEGEYHRLRVELKRPMSGARLVHRPGYYSPKPYAAQDPIEKLLEAANRVMSGEESDGIATAVLAAPFRTGGEKAYVTVILEIDGATLLSGPQPPTLPVEVYLYALDDVGAVHDFVTQTVGLDLAKAGPALQQVGVKFFGHLELLPGDYSLRVLVRNGASGVSGLKVVPVHVPAFGRGAPYLSPPLLPDPPNRWLVVREEPRGEEPQPAYPPFMLCNQPFVPASKPALVPGREVRLSLVAFNLGSGDWKAQAKVLDAGGREIPGGAFSLDECRALPGEPEGVTERAVGTFKPPALEPGEYDLKITVTGAAGGPQTNFLRFVVRSPAGR